MPHIALITYEMNQGGTNRVLCELANGFAKAGHQVTVVACTSAGALDQRFRAQLDPSVGYEALSDTPWRSRAWGQIKSVGRFSAWIAQHKPDIVLATGNNISWLSGIGALMAASPRPRLHIKTTNPVIRNRDGTFHGWFRRVVYGRLFRSADSVMTLSNPETQLLRSQFAGAADRFRTVFNAYVTARHAEIGREASPPHAPPFIMLAAGRLEAQKNFDRLLDAFALLDRGDVRLRIAGDGSERSQLESKALALGIADRVEFLGFREDVPYLMAQSHLFILSSDYEGLPAVVIEALATNCPVISTDCFANARDLLESLPGCAVCDRTAGALAEALRRWLDAKGERSDLACYAQNYTSEFSTRSHLVAMGLA